MKYRAPDYRLVTVEVETNFASGYVGGCPEDEFLQWQWTRPCEGTEDYTQIRNTYTGLGLGTLCYSTNNPPY